MDITITPNIISNTAKESDIRLSESDAERFAAQLQIQFDVFAALLKTDTVGIEPVFGVLGGDFRAEKICV